jgi:peptide/nickel transport system permease protein
MFVLVAIFAPMLSPHPPLKIDLSNALAPPFWAKHGSTDHLLGTDKLGRDVLSRMIHGARPAIIVAIASVAIAAVVGSTIGIVAAYFGRVVDQVLMRLVDIMLSFPAMLLALLLAARLGPGLGNVILVISLILWASYARQVRGDAMVVMRKEYVALARSGGRTGAGIMVRHVLPNVANTIIVLATLQLGIVIILEASLSFLGVGVPPPDPTWGGMITDGRALVETAWWLSVFPGLAILGLVLAVNVSGEWLEVFLDPRRRARAE